MIARSMIYLPAPVRALVLPAFDGWITDGSARTLFVAVVSRTLLRRGDPADNDNEKAA
jgi:hypothetical protein